VALGMICAYVLFVDPTAESVCPRCEVRFSALSDSVCRRQGSCRSHRLNSISTDLHSDGSLDQLHRDDQALIATDGGEYSLNAIETSAANTDVLPDSEIGIELERNVLFEQSLDGMNLTIGDGRSNSMATHKTDYADGTQDSDPRLLNRGNAHEHVPRK
jgi:hypothetical protein